MKLHKAVLNGGPAHPRCAAIATRRIWQKLTKQAQHRHLDHTEILSQRRAMRRRAGQ